MQLRLNWARNKAYMCGIAGKVYFSSQNVRVSDLKKMAGQIAHRGPDDEGTYVSQSGKVGLVNRRLSIIDLSAKGHQPMEYMGRYVITFNGEVYNFLSEREKLINAGYKFKSKTDTEVVIALYAKYKEKCLDHLRGMFAFAIFDKKENKLFLARDRLGKKPLKFFWGKGVFIFASELKAIITQDEISRSPDWLAIHYYLTYGYVPAPWTGFVGIEKLNPGHYMILDITQNKLAKVRYWDLDVNHKLKLSESEWISLLLKTIKESVKLRMVSDVPIGLFLSGGVDSSLVTALMAQLSPSPVRTFTIAFENQRYNESEHAARVAKKYGTDHTELIARPADIDILPHLAFQYEEPYADASAVVTYMVSQLARKHVKVVLNGDGGDENFAGYPNRYFRLKRDAILDKYHPWVGMAGKVISKTSPKAKSFFEKFKTPLAHRFASYNEFFSNFDKMNLYGDFLLPYAQNIVAYDYYLNLCIHSGAKDVRDAALYAEISAYLPDDLLVKMDIASMAVGLECRSPLVDYKIMELGARMPFNLKIKGYRETKYILKKAAEKLIPKANIYRPKMGFGIPLSDWFAGDLKSYSVSQLLSPHTRITKFINSKEIRRMIKEHSVKNDFGPKLWSLLTLELWFKKFF